MAYLKFYGSGKRRDYQRMGNYNNWKFALIKAPKDSVLTFFGTFANAIAYTSIVAKKVEIIDGIESVLQTIDLTSILTIEQSGTDFSHTAQDLLDTTLTAGVYYLEITNGTDTMQSELFCVNEALSVFSLFLLVNNNKLLVNNDKLLINNNTEI